MDRTVGVIGLGIMGGAIARNLRERGWRVVGADVDAGRRAALAADGIEIAADTAGVVGAARIVLLSLPSAAAVAEVTAEIAAAGAPPRIIAELSTLALPDKHAFA